MPVGTTEPELRTGVQPAAERDVARSLERLFWTSSDLILITDREGRIVLANPAWEVTFGWSAHELVGRLVFELVHPDDWAATRALAAEGPSVINHANRYRHKDGTWRWLLWSGSSEGDLWCAIAKDVTDRLSLERRALYDDLTGLANRGLLLDHLRAAVHRLGRAEGRLLAVLFVDLDGFKLVNDGLGHEAGDELLAAIADRLRDVVRDTDVISRFGGDEFVIVAENLSRQDEAVQLARRVVAAVGGEFELGGTRQTLSCSVGVATTLLADADPGSLLREADIAMYRAQARPLGDGSSRTSSCRWPRRLG